MFPCSVPYSTGDAGLSIPRVIINQLKWLDRVVDSKVVISVTMGFACAIVTTIKVSRCIYVDGRFSQICDYALIYTSQGEILDGALFFYSTLGVTC